MRAIGLHSIKGIRCNLWTCLPIQPLPAIVARIRERVQNGTSELHTELLIEAGRPVPPAAAPTLLTALERDVLALKLQRHPPRRIAASLGVPLHSVYAAGQQLRFKLQVYTLRDRTELFHAAQDKGALMDDPAFS